MQDTSSRALAHVLYIWYYLNTMNIKNYFHNQYKLFPKEEFPRTSLWGPIGTVLSLPCIISQRRVPSKNDPRGLSFVWVFSVPYLFPQLRVPKNLFRGLTLFEYIFFFFITNSILTHPALRRIQKTANLLIWLTDRWAHLPLKVFRCTFFLVSFF